MDRRPPAYQLRILASAVSNNLFLPPQKWTFTKGQTPSGARSERLKGFVCLPVPCLSHRSPQFPDFQSDLT